MLIKLTYNIFIVIKAGKGTSMQVFLYPFVSIWCHLLFFHLSLALHQIAKKFMPPLLRWIDRVIRICWMGYWKFCQNKLEMIARLCRSTYSSSALTSSSYLILPSFLSVPYHSINYAFKFILLAREIHSLINKLVSESFSLCLLAKD